jgi:hypothetical protein
VNNEFRPRPSAQRATGVTSSSDVGVSSERTRAPNLRSARRRISGSYLFGTPPPPILLIPGEPRPEVRPTTGGPGVPADPCRGRIDSRRRTPWRLRCEEPRRPRGSQILASFDRNGASGGSTEVQPAVATLAIWHVAASRRRLDRTPLQARPRRPTATPAAGPIGRGRSVEHTLGGRTRGLQ